MVQRIIFTISYFFLSSQFSSSFHFAKKNLVKCTNYTLKVHKVLCKTRVVCSCFVEQARYIIFRKFPGSTELKLLVNVNLISRAQSQPSSSILKSFHNKKAPLKGWEPLSIRQSTGEKIPIRRRGPRAKCTLEKSSRMS